MTRRRGRPAAAADREVARLWGITTSGAAAVSNGGRQRGRAVSQRLQQRQRYASNSAPARRSDAGEEERQWSAAPAETESRQRAIAAADDATRGRPTAAGGSGGPVAVRDYDERRCISEQRRTPARRAVSRWRRRGSQQRTTRRRLQRQRRRRGGVAAAR
ncbi:hypothetical protein Scep_004325 [Stephania cephalantha]|uniref:Uncharacterized protein n=1 Tax=Stephania cephalantha TaxID=152367 RepID=A0AAP0PZ01_9MAGN